MWSTTARTKCGEVCSMLQEIASLDNVSEEWSTHVDVKERVPLHVYLVHIYQNIQYIPYRLYSLARM